MSDTPTAQIPAKGPLYKRLTAAPVTPDDPRYAADVEELIDALQANPDTPAQDLSVFDTPQVRSLLSGIFAGSTYLSGLIRTEPERLLRLLVNEPEAHFAALRASLLRDMANATSDPEPMRLLRRFKSEVAYHPCLQFIGCLLDAFEYRGTQFTETCSVVGLIESPTCYQLFRVDVTGLNPAHDFWRRQTGVSIQSKSI